MKIEEGVTGSFGASELQLGGIQTGQRAEMFAPQLFLQQNHGSQCRPTVSVFMPMGMLGGSGAA